jgi:hypothetical protein
MASEVRIPRVRLAYSWPSMASASAELRRPRSARVGRAETPAVLGFVPPAAADVGAGTSSGSVSARNPLLNGGGLR